jgi:hypothetical protein
VALIESFLKDIDERAKPVSGVIRLHVIGSAALLLQTDHERGTKDSDVWETTDMTTEIKASLSAIAGKGSPIHHKHRMWLDFVPNGLPFLPQKPRFHSIHRLNRSLTRLHIEALDIVDTVVSKLARFNASDVEDISAMVKRGLAPHGEFVRRFRAALDAASMGAQADEFSRYVTNFHAIERDHYRVRETEIDVPDWAG